MNGDGSPALSSASSSPLVSVVIPAYRHERYIEETLGSVFAQTFRDFEVIVVNDGSPDNTASLLRPWVSSGRIRYHEQANGGQAAARNAGIRLARGKFIALLDDDDLWPADKLAWQVERLRERPDAVVAYGFAQLSGNKDVSRHPSTPGPHGQVKRALLHECFIVSPGQALIRTDDLLAVGGLDEKLRGSDDWDLWLRLADRGNFDYVDRCALNYRQHETNTYSNKDLMFRAQMRVLHKHLGRTPLGAGWRDWIKCRRFIGRQGADPELTHARRARTSGRWRDVFHHLARAVRFDPPLVGSLRVWEIIFGK